MEKIPYHRLKSLSFSIYRPEEIKKLSVLEITNPNAFDSLDHPSADGLHDPRLGPNNQEESCETCGLRYVHCPGHVGHIVLPLPVFSPVFIKTVYQLLQGTCFECHRLLAPVNAAHLVLYQFKALDYGLVGLVRELSEAVSDPALITPINREEIEKSSTVEEKLRLKFEEATRGLSEEECRESSRVKSVVECRLHVAKDFIKRHLTSAKQKCPHCGEKNSKIALRNNSQFVLIANKRASIKVQKNTINKENLNESVDDPDQEGSEDKSSNVDFTPANAKKHLNLLWKNDHEVLRHLFGVLNIARNSDDAPINMFFMEVLMVSPSRFRPIIVVKERKYLNPQSAVLKNVLVDCVHLRSLMKMLNGEDIPDEDKEEISKLPGKTDHEKLNKLWHQLQLHVNCIYDSEMDKLNKDKSSMGVKQVLEKKEGLFRKHMMGKRVNYAARSVISPDPFINVDEIGVPTIFATKLTYPTPVTEWNIEKMRMAVMNGPDIHPGADKVESPDGRVTKLSATDEMQRRAIACQLLTPTRFARGVNKGIPKIVHRHLVDGDILLLNRQPTLHKPSIMAHKARVLPGEKTLRLHYANCKSYNADFDGDEMNAHFPQSEIARSEGVNIANVNNQYLVPKDGTPLSGLIQDHIIAGTLLTIRGRFFDRADYQQLVYNGVAFLNKRVKTLPPCILKPCELWSGKQVVSTIIINIIPKGKPPPTIDGKAKVSAKNWQNAPSREWKAGGTPLTDDDMTESQVIVRSGELLCGVLDKAHIGATPYSLVHCCYELYGGETSSALLTALARVFTYFLQNHIGFTLGIEDILLTDKASRKRRKVMREARKIGDSIVALALDVEDPENKSEITEKFKAAHLSRTDTGLKMLDFEMKKATDGFNNQINGICMPNGLLKKFPKNNLQLMVQSGAKGSTVNAMQISCALGQIELEGRRVPLMMNGSTLPSFLPYDTSPRAGGFIDGRFLTGINPQEFFFHCMAGREGLVDTAVKTSRSGYLQRCLIKHLEGLKVEYDMTVRDSDGSVIQFLYGEDGYDVSKVQMLKKGKLDLLVKNYAAVVDEKEMATVKLHLPQLPVPKFFVSKHSKKKKENQSVLQRSSVSLNFSDYLKHPGISETAFPTTPDMMGGFEGYLKPKEKTRDPLNSVYRPDMTFRSICEKLDGIIQEYVEGKLEQMCKKDPDISKRERRAEAKKLYDMFSYRALKSLVQPGEAVGLLAAQSIGEPSTQMTLNTFHFAGRGEMNVTLGIPRLREILMVASASIATPTMDLPLIPQHKVEKKAENLRVKLSSVALKQVLETISIKEVLIIKGKTHRFRRYEVKMNFLPHEVYKGVLYTSPQQILKYVEQTFILRIINVVKKKLTAMESSKLLSSYRSKKSETIANGDNEQDFPPPTGTNNVDEGASSEEDDGDGDTVAAKTRARHDQELEYDDAESDENPDDPDELLDGDVTIKKEIKSESEDSTDDSEGGSGSEANEEESNDVKPDVHLVEEKNTRIQLLLNKHQWLSHYDYDEVNHLYCKFTLQLSLENTKLDMKTLIEEQANNATLYQVPNIKKAFLVKNPSSNGTEKMLKTDGVNFLEIFKYVNIIDANKVYSNDIHAIAKIYGIEAATRVIVKEVTNVFATYGIQVDPRHLVLIADYMTADGTYKPFNRIGMESNASPLQQMTFETSMNFLQSATLMASEDRLKSPSASIVVGQPVNIGTGCFDLFVDGFRAMNLMKKN